MKWLIILLSVLTANSAFACLEASQKRIFPLGLTSRGLIVVETHLQRTMYFDQDRKIDKKSPAWLGRSYFKIYDKHYKEVYSEAIDTIKLFEQQHYDSIIGSTFRKGLNLAKRYRDFIAAKPLSISFCHYQDKCSDANVVFDTVNNRISIQLVNGIQYPVRTFFDPASPASNLLQYYSGFDDAKLSVKSFIDNLYTNSVRKFEIGNKKLTVVHIGSGQRDELLMGEESSSGGGAKAGFAFTDINKSVFGEPVLHHGHGFDFYIWE